MQAPEHLIPPACAQPVHIFRLRSKFFIRREESNNAEATTEFSKQSSTVRSPPRPTTSILYSLTPSTKVSSLSVLKFFSPIFTLPFILDQFFTPISIFDVLLQFWIPWFCPIFCEPFSCKVSVMTSRQKRNMRICFHLANIVLPIVCIVFVILFFATGLISASLSN